MSDRLHDTLSALRTDVDHMPLADSSAVRARGTQRTRRQAVGTSLAVVALVAGAVGISGALTGNNNADNLPADHTTTAPTAETPHPIDPALLVSPSMIPAPNNQALTEGETLTSPTAAQAEEKAASICGVSLNPAVPVPPVNSYLRFFHSDLDATAWEWIAQYDSDRTAQVVFNELTATCTTATGVQTKAIGSATTPNTIRASQFSSDPGSEFNGQVTGIAVRGDTVVVLSVSAMMRESEFSLGDFDAAAVSAADEVANR